MPQPKIPIPSVTKASTASFAKVWNKGGVAIILDDTAIQFATDWANIALRSFVEQQMQIAAAKMKAAQAQAEQAVSGQQPPPTNAVASQPVPAPKSSGIIITG